MMPRDSVVFPAPRSPSRKIRPCPPVVLAIRAPKSLMACSSARYRVTSDTVLAPPTTDEWLESDHWPPARGLIYLVAHRHWRAARPPGRPRHTRPGPERARRPPDRPAHHPTRPTPWPDGPDDTAPDAHRGWQSDCQRP